MLADTARVTNVRIIIIIIIMPYRVVSLCSSVTHICSQCNVAHFRFRPFIGHNASSSSSCSRSRRGPLRHSCAMATKNSWSHNGHNAASAYFPF